MKNNQKLRLIINGISIHTTPKTIEQGIGDNPLVNSAAKRALEELELITERGQKIFGWASNVTIQGETFYVQIDCIS